MSTIISFFKAGRVIWAIFNGLTMIHIILFDLKKALPMHVIPFVTLPL